MLKPETVVIPLRKIHETAVVHPNARIGKDVEIAPYAVVGENVVIGDGTKIGAHVVIDGWTSIGKNCVIFSSAAIGGEPQDLKFRGEKSYVFIGDNTKIREFATVNRATGEDEETRIGSHCLLQAYTHVAHNCVVGNHVIMSNCATLAGHVVVEDRANIGGLSELARSNMKKAYKILYRSGLSLAQAIDTMEQELDSCEEVEHFLRFLRNAERGIARSRRDNTEE